MDPVVGFKLFENVTQVGIDCMPADAEDIANLRVRFSMRASVRISRSLAVREIVLICAELE